MRKSLVLIVIIINSFNLSAQTVEWISTGAGDNIYSQDDIGYSVISNDEYVYVAGYIAGNNVKINDTDVANGNISFLASFNTSGDLKWIKENEGEEPSAVALNSNGEIYTVYTTWDLKNFVLKYDADGNELWNKQIKNIDKVTAITTDTDDNLIIAGNYNAYIDSLVIEDTVIYDISKDRTNGFLMKYDSNGEFKWFNSTKVISSYGGYALFYDIKTDMNGNSYIIGGFELYDIEDSLKVGNDYLKIETNPEYEPSYFSHKDIILTKLNSNGEFIWAKQYGSYNDDYGNGIDVTDNGDIFIIGNFTDSISFNDHFLTTYGVDLFLTKVNTEGNAVWSNKFGSNAMNSLLEQGRTVAVDEQNVYIGGSYNGAFCSFSSVNKEDTTINFDSNIRTGFFANYTIDGDFVEVEHIIVNVENLQGENTNVEDIHINDEHIYITGNFYPPSTFFDTTIPVVYTNSNHFFLAAVDINNTNTSTNYVNNVANKVKLFPNPAQEYLILEVENNEFYNDIVIYDVAGNLLIKKKHPDSNKIDISSLPDGLYIIKTYSGNDVCSNIFLKTNR